MFYYCAEKVGSKRGVFFHLYHFFPYLCLLWNWLGNFIPRRLQTCVQIA